MRSLLITCFLLINALSYSQKKTDTIWNTNTYVSLKSYKNTYGEPLTKKDSLNFKFKDNDTLVLIKDYVRPQGTMVPYEFKDSTFLYYYKKVAFNHKNDSINKKTSMKYWKDDIRIFFSKSVSKKTKKDFMLFADQIDKAVDSLHIKEVKNVEDSNYIIYYFGDYEYESRMDNYTYSTFYASWKHNKIYRTTIRLDESAFFGDALIQYKLRELFFQSIGYFVLIDDFACESYFSNCYSPNKRLTELDIELLKYHYSYGICKGTSLETFEGQHQKAKEIFEKTGHQMRFFHPYEQEQ